MGWREVRDADAATTRAVASGTPGRCLRDSGARSSIHRTMSQAATTPTTTTTTTAATTPTAATTRTAAGGRCSREPAVINGVIVVNTVVLDWEKPPIRC